jgi:hypothetical protein
VVATQDDDAVDGADRVWRVGAGRVHDDVPSVPDVVRRTLRGPRDAERELLAAAEQLGFRPDDGDEQ